MSPSKPGSLGRLSGRRTVPVALPIGPEAAIAAKPGVSSIPVSRVGSSSSAPTVETTGGGGSVGLLLRAPGAGGGIDALFARATGMGAGGGTEALFVRATGTGAADAALDFGTNGGG